MCPFFLYLGDLHCGHTSLMIMASVDLSWIGKRFGVNSNTKSVGEHYMNITPARGGQPAADRPERPLQSPLDWRRQTLSAAQSVGVDRGVGVCHRQCRG